MTTTPPPLPEPAAPAPASSSWAEVSAPRWGTDLPIPHHCTLHPTGGLTTTDLRTALITAVTTGTVLNLDPPPDLELDEGTYYLHPPGTTLDTLEGDRTDTTAIATWIPNNHPTIPAHWIRTILKGRTPSDPAETPTNSRETVPLEHIDPRGLQITGAHISGNLDLDLLATQTPLGIHHSHLPYGITAAHAHLLTLNLDGSILTHPTGPALAADGLTVDSDMFVRAEFTGSGEHGAVQLLNAHIGGRLVLSEATLTNPSGPALTADSLTVDGVLSARAATFTGSGQNGTLRLPNAHIGGQLVLSGANLHNFFGPALLADSLTVDSDMFANATFTGSGEYGAVRLLAAHIGGQLVLDGATLTNLTGPALLADRLIVDSDMFANSTFTGSGQNGSVRLQSAHIGGRLVLSEATLTNPSGPALTADSLTTDSDMLANSTFTGSGEHGTVRLQSAHIGGRLVLSGATLRNVFGPALLADSLTVDNDMFANATFTGSGEHGTVQLQSAHIGGRLVLSGATLTNPSGPALTADSLTTDSDIVAAATFTGSGEYGAVRLPNAHIGGRLVLSGATLTNLSGPALTAGRLTVDSDLSARAATFTGSGKNGAVRLADAHVGGRLWLDLGTTKNVSHKAARWVVDGFTYTGYPAGLKLQHWLEELRQGTLDYAAQPYRHLAEIAHAAGHDTDERTILIAQRQDQIDRGGIKRSAKLWARFTGVMLGYGYKPARMAWALLIIIAAALTATLTLSAHGATTTLKPPTTTSAAPITSKDAEGHPCTPVQQAGYALDSSLPLIKTPLSGSCTTTPTTTGTALAATLALLQLLAWATTTLFIAGYTRIVRRT